jgi:thiamine transport system ATP-binding protein
MVKGLVADGITVRFGAVTAVDDVTLDVAAGEIVAVLGASGSGKSSLLRAIAGLEPLAAGRVGWDGADVTGVPVHQRGFVVMFQDGQLFPHLSVGGNVGYALHRQPAPRRRERVEELLGLVGLDGYAGRPITALSGGEAQRVALARSLAADPRLLMLDEPLSSLDAGLRERLTGELGEALRATGTPAVYVTHDQDEAFAIADRVAVLSAGRLLQVDAPAALWTRPASREVAEFLGYGPFLPSDVAAALGRPDMPAGALLALGPDALVPDPWGISVSVLATAHGRGETFCDVALPGGRVGTIRLKGIVEPGDQLVIGIDQTACAIVPEDDPRTDTP